MRGKFLEFEFETTYRCENHVLIFPILEKLVIFFGNVEASVIFPIFCAAFQLKTNANFSGFFSN